MYELIITEKPSSAKKIAEALADGKPLVEKSNGVSTFKVTHEGKDIVIVSAVGHLFTVAEKEKSFKYPSFDLEWVPTADIDKKAAFSKKYLTIIKKAAKDANSFTIACDYDIEGEVIGLNIVRYLCKQKDASRMKFSTLTREDLRESYARKSKTLDWPQAKAGETRHFLDWLYGINLSRALTLAVKATGSFKLLSSGRVQGPALKIVVEKEKEIKAFKPEPYWVISLKAEKDKSMIEAIHEKDKFFDKKEAGKVYDAIKDEKKTIIDGIDKKKFNQAPPNPFDLGSLQSESYKLFNISPKETLQLAQDLYLAGVTSYPRTSSQKLPKEIGYKKIIESLGKNAEYSKYCKMLLSMKSLTPNDGKKTDPAHPAIYPTGVKPSKLTERQKKVYDLVVKRFFATFGEPAERETVTLTLDVKNEKFKAKGTHTVSKGWHELYEPYVKLSEDELPALKNKEELRLKSIDNEEKETQPPKRFTPASIISELEKRGLGTKATRADIVESLYQRGYINDKSIEATELGMKIETTLDKYCPEIIDEELTRKFEEELEKIRDGTIKPEQVLEEAKEDLTKTLKHFKSQEKQIGEELISAHRETQDIMNTLGVCPVCKEGLIKIRRGKFGMFAACDKYPDCKTTFSLPKFALIKPTEKVSPKGYPVILVIRKGKKPQELSLLAEENSADLSKEEQKVVDDVKSGKVEKKCPKCGSPLKVQSSIYGEFFGCTTYPKCKYTEPLNGDSKKNE